MGNSSNLCEYSTRILLDNNLSSVRLLDEDISIITDSAQHVVIQCLRYLPYFSIPPASTGMLSYRSGHQPHPRLRGEGHDGGCQARRGLFKPPSPVCS